MAFFNVIWFGLVWYGMVWFGMVWFGLVQCPCENPRSLSSPRAEIPLVWFGLVGLVWFGIVWYGLVWEPLFSYQTKQTNQTKPNQTKPNLPIVFRIGFYSKFEGVCFSPQHFSTYGCWENLIWEDRSHQTKEEKQIRRLLATKGKEKTPPPIK